MPGQRVHPEAAGELRAAVAWYKEKEPSVSRRFVERTAQAREDISLWPSAAVSFMIAEDGTVIRSKSVRGYPYRVIYSVEPDAIFIVAFAHDSRKPGYWQGRLDELRRNN